MDPEALAQWRDEQEEGNMVDKGVSHETLHATIGDLFR